MNQINDENLEEILRITEILPKLKYSVISNFFQQLEIYKDELDEIIKNKMKNISLMPSKDNSEQFRFIMTYNSASQKWDVDIDDNQLRIPVSSIIPNELQKKLATSDIAPDVFQTISFDTQNFSYVAHFERCMKSKVAGVVQKTPGQQNDNAVVINMFDYLNLPEAKQIEIFKKYFDNSEELRQSVLLQFFTDILPTSRTFQRLISM